MLYNRAPATKVIGEIQKRRADAGKLVAGVAAASNSDMFKGPVCWTARDEAFRHHADPQGSKMGKEKQNDGIVSRLHPRRESPLTWQ